MKTLLEWAFLPTLVLMVYSLATLEHRVKSHEHRGWLTAKASEAIGPQDYQYLLKNDVSTLKAMRGNLIKISELRARIEALESSVCVPEGG